MNLTFTALFALIFSFIILAKILSFAIYNKGFKHQTTKTEKRLHFVNHVIITEVDHHETEISSQNLQIMDQIDQFGQNGFGHVDCGVDSFKENIIAEKIGEKEDTLLVTDKLKNVIVEEVDHMVVNQHKGNKELGEGICGARIVEMEEEEAKPRDEGFDDDWEGIDRSESEKVFAEAVNYLEYGVKKNEKLNERNPFKELSSEVQMQLYGLHKIAVEGPCHEPPPMALKLAARAKWNAWDTLGSMSQEEAMEQYIKLLSDSLPHWMHDYSADKE